MTNALAFWDNHAPKYAKAKIQYPDSYDRSIAQTATYLGPQDNVLELGCGTGTTALRLAAAVGQYTGTDIAPSMIKIAKEKAWDQSLRNLSFEVATLEEATNGAQVDAILAFNLFHLLPDLDAKVAACFDSLVPGGVLVSKTFITPRRFNLMFAGMRLALPAMQWLGKAPPVHFCSHEDLVAAHTRAGFDIVEDDVHCPGKLVRRFMVARKPL